MLRASAPSQPLLGARSGGTGEQQGLDNASSSPPLSSVPRVARSFSTLPSIRPLPLPLPQSATISDPADLLVIGDDSAAELSLPKPAPSTRRGVEAAGARASGWGHFLVLTLSCTGVVFGDIGTSPLYAFAGIYVSEMHASPSPEDIMGTARAAPPLHVALTPFAPAPPLATTARRQRPHRHFSPCAHPRATIAVATPACAHAASHTAPHVAQFSSIFWALPLRISRAVSYGGEGMARILLALACTLPAPHQTLGKRCVHARHCPDALLSSHAVRRLRLLSL